MDQKNERIVCTIVIFGATGNLTSLKLFPAIYELYENHGKDYTFRILGFARRDWTDATLREVAQKALMAKNSSLPGEFLSNIHYIASSFDDDKGYDDLKRLIQPEAPTLYYFSIDPTSYFTILEKMKNHGFAHLDGNKRIVLEKPFGTNLTTAEELDRRLKSVFEESELYNIDHYLGKEMVQNLLRWRLANPMLDATWNNSQIKSIEILLDELVDVEDRPAFYDQTGTLSDMVQNHAFQILSMLTAGAKETRTKGLANAKAQIIQSLFIADWATDVIRAQYDGYRKPILPENTQTETFIALKLQSSLPQWSGVSFFIKTGKALEAKKSVAIVNFKGSSEPLKIEFILHSDNTPIITSLTKPPFLADKTVGTFLEEGDTLPPKRALTDYSSLIFACLQSDKTHFVSLTEIKASWRLIDDIRDHFSANPILNYTKGTAGPEIIHDFLPSLRN